MPGKAGRHADRGRRRVLDGRRHRRRAEARARSRRSTARALFVDEAHSLGVIGPSGAGTAAHFGVTDDVDLVDGHVLQVVRLDRRVRRRDRERDPLPQAPRRPLMFTAALPPAYAAGVHAALEVIQSEPERRESLLGQHPAPARGLPPLGFDTARRDADHPGPHRAAGEDVPLLARAVRRRRVRQPGGAARRAAVACRIRTADRDAHRRPDRPVWSSSGASAASRALSEPGHRPPGPLRAGT